MRAERNAPLTLLDIDPDLPARTGADSNGVVGRGAAARTVTLPSGAPPSSWPACEGLGLFVAEGILLRRLTVGRARAVEFIGPGDLIQPSRNSADETASIPAESAWHLLTPATLGLLDDAFVERVARVSPTTVASLLSRSIDRSRWLTYFLAIHSLVHVRDRLVHALWRLADRWGRVGADGIVIEIPHLTHELLAELVGARRPSVTTAVSQLTREGTLRRGSDGLWVLGGLPACEPAAVTASGNGAVTSPP